MASQAHPFWQYQYLHTAGLPTSNANVNFLSDWGQLGNAGCAYNANDLSHREPGSTRCRRLPNGKYARSYTDTQSAAHAFAAQLTVTAYPNLLTALLLGDPYKDSDLEGVAFDIDKWGSPLMAAYLRKQAGAAASTVTAKKAASQSKNVGGAWSHLMRTLAVDGHRTIIELQRETAALNRIDRRLRRA